MKIFSKNWVFFNLLDVRTRLNLINSESSLDGNECLARWWKNEAMVKHETKDGRRDLFLNFWVAPFWSKWHEAWFTCQMDRNTIKKVMYGASLKMWTPSKITHLKLIRLDSGRWARRANIMLLFLARSRPMVTTPATGGCRRLTTCDPIDDNASFFFKVLLKHPFIQKPIAPSQA